jgi:predicted nucleic acid-binding protein
MVYVESDFFLAFLKESDWLKTNAERLYERYKGDLQTSLVTFIELMLVAKKFQLSPIKITAAVMKMTEYPDVVPLQAAKYIEDGLGVFDAFHAASCNGVILSSDHIYDDLNIQRIKLENPPQ